MELHLKNVSILREFDRVRVRHRYNKTLSDWSPLRPPNFTLTVECNYSTVTVCYTFHNTSIIYTEVWRIPFIWEATALSFHIQYFYKSGNLTSSNVDTNISHQRRCGLLYEKEANIEHPPPPPMLRGTSTPLPNALLSLRFPYKYKPKLPLSDFNSNAQEFHLEIPLY